MRATAETAPLSPILVGLDFSSSSLLALSRGARLALDQGRTLRCVHAIDERALRELSSVLGRPLDRLREEAIHRAHDEVGLIARDLPGGMSGVPLVSAGHPREVLAREVERWQASLLVLGAFGVEGGPQPGSVAMSSVRHAPCDVLLVRQSDDEPYRRVLACTGLGAASDAVVERAASLAAPGGALTLLHVANPPWRHAYLRGPWSRVSPEAGDLFRHGVQVELDRATARARAQRPDLKVTPVLLDGSTPSEQILRWAATHDPQLLVLGNRSTGLLDTLLLGSTATRVLEGATCDTLTVEPHRRVPEARDGASRGPDPTAT